MRYCYYKLCLSSDLILKSLLGGVLRRLEYLEIIVMSSKWAVLILPLNSNLDRAADCLLNYKSIFCSLILLKKHLFCHGRI